MGMIFLTSNAATVIKDVIKHLSKSPKEMKLVFIMTAAEGDGGNQQWLKEDRDTLRSVGFSVTDYTLRDKTESDVRKDLSDFDVIFFSGGNTFYLLEKIQQSNSKAFFKEQIEKGVIYIGSSAGSVVAGPSIEVVKKLDAQEKAPHLKGFAGLALVDFTVLPHWGSKYFKDLYLNQRLEHAYSMDNKLILLTDKQYV
ncbi:MAG TPA: Type 1 glutamine amidotransferase-like domain-containing protein, partial [Candidatus Saccharimonadales bacterium]|nr:Type 1 glutamine amidotransferase-like domain-containing protein [Candidatus Saccharimonadales bacterium]